jgi:hypothetical protein
MTFAAESIKRTTESYYLVRVEGRRDITSSYQFTFPGDDIYTHEIDAIISGVQQNGTVFTSVAVGATLSNNQYYYDPETNEISFKTVTHPDSDNVIIIKHYLLFADQPYMEAYLTPTSSTGDLYPWQARLTSVSSVNQDLTNNLNGIISISGGTFEVSNADYYYNKFFSTDDSFSSAQLVIWQGFGSSKDVSNIKLVYKGIISDIGDISKRISWSFTDGLGALKNIATMGDSADEIYFTTAGFPNVDPAKQDAPVPYVFGSVSKYRHISSGSLVPGEFVDPESMMQAVCTSYNETLSTTVNRTWGCCRVEDWENFSFTIAGIVQNPSNTRLLVNYMEPHDGQFWHGDTFQITGGGLTSYKVISFEKFSAYSHYVYVTKDLTLTTSHVVVGNAVPGLWFYDDGSGTYYPLLYGTHYTASATTTSGGNKYLSVTLANNFEATATSDGLPIDPSVDRLFFRVHPIQGTGAYTQKKQRHGSCVKFILEKAGLATSAAFFTSANSLLPVNCNFTIPYFDQSQYSPYFEYVEKIIESTYAYIGQDLDGNATYGTLRKAVSPAQSTLTEDDILKDSFSVKVDYQDIVTSIITYNPYFSDTANAEQNDDGKATQSITSKRARYLHSVENVVNFFNVLEKMDDVIDRLFGGKSERNATYSLEVKNKALQSLLATNHRLIVSGLLGTDADRYVKYLGLNKQKNKTTIKALDLFGA